MATMVLRILATANYIAAIVSAAVNTDYIAAIYFMLGAILMWLASDSCWREEQA
jgi:hypothetical protein